MPSYRGNLGNLLQHWMLCEVLTASRQYSKRLDFVDAHAMAPMAKERPKEDTTSQRFDFVRHRLSAEFSTYERAWNRMAQAEAGYPNSASFVAAVWAKPYSMLLCEKDVTTARELRRWAAKVRRRKNCISLDVAQGDWRNQLRKGLTLTGELVLFSFDPYMFDRHGPGKNPKTGNMYPEDLDILGKAIRDLNQGVIVQFSTYSANNDNPQDAVVEFLKSRLECSGLKIVALVPADGNMMSVLLARNINWARRLKSIPAQFESWLSTVPKKSARPPQRRR